MRYDATDGYFCDNDNMVIAEIIPFDFEGEKFEELNAELARRVNGWEALESFAAEVLRNTACSCGSCNACRAREALRKAEVE